MPAPKPPTSADERPIFPFDILWAGYGNAKVTLADLLEHEAEYRAFSDQTHLIEDDPPFVTEDQVQTISIPRGLSEEQAHSLWLICCYYLAPKQAAAFGLDPRASRRLLLRAAHAASQLERALGSLAPKVLAALYYIRPTINDVLDPRGSPFHILENEAADFSRVARAVAVDLTRADGRPRHHERDTMIRLCLETFEDAGLLDLKISNGTKARPDPHLSGVAGKLLIDLFRLIEPGWREEWLAPKVKAVRAKMRKERAAGAKTRRS